MYDEFERNVAGAGHRRAGAGTWILLGLAGFMFVGIAASVAGFFMVRRKVVEVVERMEAAPAMTATRMLQRLDPDLQVIMPSGGEQVGMDLARAMEGGRLLIRSPEGEIQVGGGDVLAPPAWVPEVAGRPGEPRQIFSARSAGRILGAVTWEVEQTPPQVVDAFREALLDAGFSARLEASAREEGRRGDHVATLWAESLDGERHLFVVAAREDGRTTVVLGFGHQD